MAGRNEACLPVTRSSPGTGSPRVFLGPFPVPGPLRMPCQVCRHVSVGPSSLCPFPSPAPLRTASRLGAWAWGGVPALWAGPEFPPGAAGAAGCGRRSPEVHGHLRLRPAQGTRCRTTQHCRWDPHRQRPAEATVMSPPLALPSSSGKSQGGARPQGAAAAETVWNSSVRLDRLSSCRVRTQCFIYISITRIEFALWVITRCCPSCSVAHVGPAGVPWPHPSPGFQGLQKGGRPWLYPAPSGFCLGAS